MAVELAYLFGIVIGLVCGFGLGVVWAPSLSILRRRSEDAGLSVSRQEEVEASQPAASRPIAEAGPASASPASSSRSMEGKEHIPGGAWLLSDGQRKALANAYGHYINMEAAVLEIEATQFREKRLLYGTEIRDICDKHLKPEFLKAARPEKRP